jgi:hypothetical protein
LRGNRTRYWVAAGRYARQAGRIVRHRAWERAWFWVLGITRPMRNAAGLRGMAALERARGKR